MLNSDRPAGSHPCAESKGGADILLIETIFDIDGFGLLGFNSVIDRDYPVVMGILTLSATLMLLGNILSDALVALVDPRVRFE